MTTRKTALGLALALPLWLGAPVKNRRGNPPPPPFSLHIQTRGATFAPGAEVMVTFSLRNNSSATIQTPSAITPLGRVGEDLFEIRVLSATGRPAPPTAYSKLHAKPQMVGEMAPAVVRPGTTLHGSILINRLFDITAPGSYTIQVCADWRAPATKLSMARGLPRMYPRTCSNKIAVAVTQ